MARPNALGYLTKRTSPVNPYLWELGTCAYGPAAEETVYELSERVRRWDRARKSSTGVSIEVHPAGQGDAADALMVVDKRHSRLVVTLLGHLQKLLVVEHARRRGTALATPFHVGETRRGMARMPTLPDDGPGLDTPVEPVVAEGMFLSSEGHAGTSPEGIERRRVTARAFRIRARRRTTPQGVFAAVADLEIADSGIDLSVDGVRTRSYPSPILLHQVVDRALDSADVLRGLKLSVNNLVVRRGGRLEVERPSGDARTGPQRMSIRATEVVEVVMEVCRSGASWRQVAAAVSRRWPNVPEAAVDSVLRTMARHGFVLTDLAPVDPCNDPISHVLDRLPEAEQLHKKLSRLWAALAEADAYPPGHPARMAALGAARKLTDDELASTWRTVCVDSASDARLRVPKGMAEQVARVAGVLWRMAPGHDRLADWHERFLHRYGAQRPVPLLEACDPVTGLGCEVGDADRPPPPKATGVLADLLFGTLTSGRMEVNLDPATIEALDQREPGDHPEPSVELYARVVAPGGRSGGNFVLVVTDLASPAGSTRARFTGLLPAPGVDADTGRGTMTAELTFQPLSRAAAALTGRGDSALWRIPIGTLSRPGDLRLDELALVSDGRHLSLWSTRHQRPVRPVHHNRLGHHLMPPLAGFLCLLGQHGTVPLSLWKWAPFDSAPFLPRVRCHDTILAPARWRLPEYLRRAARERAAWHKALHYWHTTARPTVPNTIVVGDTDRQLPLDLDCHDDCELLRRYVARGVAAVIEPPGGDDAVQAVVAGPTGYHGLEIVVPLSADPDPEPAVAPSSPAHVRGPGEGLFLPGGEWLSLAVNAKTKTTSVALPDTDATATSDAVWPAALETMRRSASTPDPRKIYDQLSRAGPLVRVTEQHWLVVGYEASLRALTDRNLGVQTLPSPARRPQWVVDLSFSQLNGQEHRRLRRVVSSMFSTAPTAAMAQHVRENADALVRAFAERSDLDFVRDVAETLPISTLSRMFGVPASKRSYFASLARTVSAATDGTRSAEDSRRALAVRDELLVLFHELLRSSVELPEPSLLASLREAAGSHISESEADALLMLMVVAGIATTSQAIAGGTLALATHPAQWAKLREDTALVPQATREILRYACPVTAVRRMVLADMTLNGQLLRSGQEVAVAIAVANRDPRSFVAPHQFRVDRDLGAIDLAFAYGSHRCIGGRLAVMEIGAVLTAMIERFHRLELMADPSWLSGSNLRGPARLPLRVTK